MNLDPGDVKAEAEEVVGVDSEEEGPMIHLHRVIMVVPHLSLDRERHLEPAWDTKNLNLDST